MKIFSILLIVVIHFSYIVAIYSFAVGKSAEFMLLNAIVMMYAYILHSLENKEK